MLVSRIQRAEVTERVGRHLDIMLTIQQVPDLRSYQHDSFCRYYSNLIFYNAISFSHWLPDASFSMLFGGSEPMSDGVNSGPLAGH